MQLRFSPLRLMGRTDAIPQEMAGRRTGASDQGIPKRMTFGIRLRLTAIGPTSATRRRPALRADPRCSRPQRAIRMRLGARPNLQSELVGTFRRFSLETLGNEKFVSVRKSSNPHGAQAGGSR